MLTNDCQTEICVTYVFKSYKYISCYTKVRSIMGEYRIIFTRFLILCKNMLFTWKYKVFNRFWHDRSNRICFKSHDTYMEDVYLKRRSNGYNIYSTYSFRDTKRILGMHTFHVKYRHKISQISQNSNLL